MQVGKMSKQINGCRGVLNKGVEVGFFHIYHIKNNIGGRFLRNVEPGGSNKNKKNSMLITGFRARLIFEINVREISHER